MAKISKSDKDFNIYRVECSFGELKKIQELLSGQPDPVADDLSAAIEWYLDNEVPPPGMSKEEFKKGREEGTLPNGKGEGELPEPPEEGEAPELPPEAPAGEGAEEADKYLPLPPAE